MSSNQRKVWLRRAAIWASLLKAITCAAVGGWSIWQMTLSTDALVGMFAFFVGAVSVIGSVGYLLGAFLLSRRIVLWQFSGGIIDATLTALVAWVFFWLADRSFAAVNAYGQGDPGVLPAEIFEAIGVAWIAASIPMLAWFLLGAAARFQLRRQQT